ncbi:PHD-zinc-finger like domain/PHD-like zinc-binding domain containing protein, putative [Leishmania guyanensis]
MATAGAITKAAAPKKNTVDYIPSKLGYDTAIPVTILEDRSDFIEKCKPYDIIDGPNPLDDSEVTVATRPRTPTALVPPASEVILSERLIERSSRRRSHSGLKAEKPPATKQEREDEEEQDRAAFIFTRPSRDRWAEERLADHRPYQLVRSSDIETYVQYVLDDVDYDWCEREKVSPESLQRGVTYLEWAYTSSLLKAARPHVTSPKDSGTAASDSVVTRHGEAAHLSSTLSSSHASATVTSNGRCTYSRRQKGKDKTSAGDVPLFLCALCSMPVPVLMSQPWTSAEGCATGGPNSLHERQGETTHSTGAFSSPPIARGDIRIGGRYTGSVSALQPPLPALHSNRGLSDVGAGAPDPSQDVQYKGLRCCDCGVVAHLRCWFFSEPPKRPEAWICDGCTAYARHHRRSACVCCMCSRPGGVLLPYVSSAAKDNSDGVEPKSPHVSSPHALSSSAAALSDMVCHAVCALSIPELSVHFHDTVLRRNGLVDMQMRPYVYALRRVGKPRYAMNCVFCHHGSGRCVQCSHPHCFEAMHASCAAEAHTIDWRIESPFVPTIASFSSASAGPPAGNSTSNGITPPVSPGSSLMSTASWTSCSPYCRKHYGYAIGNSVSSAALGRKAEAEALALDLTGLLTGGDGLTSPVVRKRGRGRPPAAVVKQREAERDLISRIRAYWLERREQRRQSSAQLASEINARLRPIVEASLRPEIVKVSAEKVRLSHFLSLVPEWQWQLVAIVEGELPLPDEEYDDVQKFRKVTHTRHSGNTRSLYDKMCASAVQLDLLCQVAEAMKEQCRLRRTSVELELAALRILSGWK